MKRSFETGSTFKSIAYQILKEAGKLLHVKQENCEKYKPRNFGDAIKLFFIGETK